MNDEGLLLLAEFEIRSDRVSMAEWLDVWGRRAQDARVHEDYTPTYAAAISDEHPDHVLIFERYRGGEEALYQHMERAAHTDLMDEMGERQMTRRRVSMAWLKELPDWGRWAPTDRSERAIEGTLAITGLSFSDKPEQERFVEEGRLRAANLAAGHGSLQIIGAATVAKPDNRRPQLATGDVVVISIATEPNAELIQPAQWPEACNARLVVAEQYRTTGIGYLWKQRPRYSGHTRKPAATRANPSDGR